MKNKVKKILKEAGVSFLDDLYSIVLMLYGSETKLMFGLTEEFKAIWIANRMTQIKVVATYVKPLGSGKMKIIN